MANGAATTGIIPRRYKSGSVIYFESDKSEYIYILKSGGILLTSTNLETGEEVKENVSQGEFFGVKSAIGKYPREETAQVIGETIVLLLPMAEFERLVLGNVQIVKKMLRVFSNQLRRIGKTVRSVLGESGMLNPDVELFKIGEYYYKAGVHKQAEYAYKKYMEHYPDGGHASLAMERINSIKSGTGAEDVMDMSTSTIENDMMSPEIENNNMDGDDFDFSMDDPSLNEPPTDGVLQDDNSFDDFSMDGGDGSELSSEMDEFLDDDDSFADDDFDFDGGSETDLMKADNYYEGGDYGSALSKYQEIVDAGAGSSSTADLQAAQLGVANSLFKLGKAKPALEGYTNLIKSNPESEIIKKSYLGIGSVFLSVNQKDKAMSYIKKVISLQPADDVTESAKKMLSEIQNG